MKTTVKRAIRDEQGKVLILVLVLLVVGGLVLTPLLGLMSTGLVAGQVYEKKTAELYAADAGVEDAIWKIQNRKADFDENGHYSYPEPLIINGKNVDVVVYRYDWDPTPCGENLTYQILSTATGAAGSDTTIHAVLQSTSLNYSDLTGSAITSGGNVTILPQGTNSSQIQGDISLPPGGVMDPAFWEEDGYEGGEVKRETLIWPELDDLEEFYWQDVEHGTHYDLDTVIELNGQDDEVGALYVDGKLTIKNSNKNPATLTLTGTIYSTDVTSIAYGAGGTGQNKPMILDLNGYTIFVTSESTGEGHEALKIGNKCTIEGPGVIIAVGDIYFKPNIEAGMTEPIVIYSVQGTTRLQPGGDFYGSILGYAEVELQPDNTIIYPDGGFGELNFPGLIEGKEGYSIESWEIK